MLKAGNWPSIIMLYLYGVVATSIVTQVVPVIGNIIHVYHIGHATAGWVISIPSLITALVALFGGYIADRVGERWVILAGCLLTLTGDLIAASAQTFDVLIAARLLEGLGYLSLTIGAVTMIMQTTSGARRGAALALWSSHTAVGVGVTLIVVAPLAQRGDAWRWAFGGHAILLAALAMAVAALPRGYAHTFTRQISDILMVLKTLSVYRVAFASCASALLQTGIMVGLTFYLSHLYAISVPAAASVGTLGEAVNAVGCLSVGPLLKRNNPPAFIALAGAILLTAGGMALYLPGMSLLGAIIGTSVFTFGIGLTNGLIWATVPTVSPASSTLGTTSGLVAQATYLGVLLGPPAIFATFAPGGWVLRLGLVLVMAVLQVGLLPIWSVKRMANKTFNRTM